MLHFILILLCASSYATDINNIIPQDVVDPAEFYDAVQAMKENNAIERYVYFTNDRVKMQISSRFCNQQNETNPLDFEQCQWKFWIEGLIWTAAIPLVSAVLLPLIMKVFLCGRRCCCGMYIPTTGVCGGKVRKGKHGYSFLHRWVFRILFIALFILYVVAMSLGNAVNVGLQDGVENTLEFAGQTSENVFNLVNRSRTMLDNLGFSEQYPDVVTVFDQISGIKDHVDKGINIARESTDKFMTKVTLVIALITGVPVLLTGLSVVGSLINCRYLMLPFLIVSSPLIFLGLLSGGVLTPVSIGISDACYAIEQLKEVEDLSTLNPELVLLSCNASLDNSLPGYARRIDTIINESFTAACNEWKAYCDTEFPCVASETNNTIISCKLLDCTDLPECSRDSMWDYFNSTLRDYNLGCYEGTFEYNDQGEVVKTEIEMIEGTTCPMNASKEVDLNNIDAYCEEFGTIAPESESDILDNKVVLASICNGASARTISAKECATECSMSVLREIATEATKLMEMAEEAMEVYENDIKPLLNCHAATQIAYNVTDLLCAETFMHFTPLSRSLLIIGYGTFIGMFLTTMGWKRANRKYHKRGSKNERDRLMDDDDDDYYYR